MIEDGEKKRQRVSRACEQCRRKKVKCLGSPPTCNNCLTLGLQCQYLASTKKRGPPKGYIEAIEGRLHRLEALLGSITQEDDPRSQAILAELNAPLETAYGELVRPRPMHHSSLHGLEDIPTSMTHMKNEGITDHHETEQKLHEGAHFNHESPNASSYPDQHKIDNDQHYHRDTEDSKNSSSNGNNGNINNDSKTAGSSSSQTQQRPDHLDNLSIDDSGQLRYYGKSSGFDMLHSSKNLKNGSVHFNSNDFKAKRAIQNDGEMTTSAPVDPFELPPDDLSQHLLDLYFKTFYPWLPLIHKDSFMERMTSKDNRPPALLLNAIFAVTSRVSSDVRVRTDPSQPDTAGDIFFERARLLMDLEWDDFKVYTVQSLLLMSSHQNGALKTIRGWIYSGMAFRMAQNLGLHRNCDNWDLTEVEKEERKRCFYCCFVVDRLSCAMHGRSPVLDERDYDTLYPNYEDKDENGQSLQVMERFHQLIKLCELLGDVLRDLYMVRGRKQLSMMTCPDSVVAGLDRALNKWMTKLPAAMQYRPPNTRLAERGRAPALQLCQLHMLFYTTLILLHRPFIPGSSTRAAPSVFPSASICTFAANKILDITESLLADGLLNKVNNYALYFMFTAGIIFIHNAQSTDSMFAFEAKISINKIMRAMDEVEKTWSTSARHCNILGALAGLRDIDLENVDESYSRSQKSIHETLPPLSIAVPNSPEIDRTQQQPYPQVQHNQYTDATSPSSQSSISSPSLPAISPSSSLPSETYTRSSNAYGNRLEERYSNYFAGLNSLVPQGQNQRQLEFTESMSLPSLLTSASTSAKTTSSSSSNTATVSRQFGSISAVTSSPLSHLHMSSSQDLTFPNHQTPDTSQRPFDPNATAFWEIPSSFDIQEWNSYLTDQAQKIDPMMMPPIIEHKQVETTPNLLSQDLPSRPPYQQ